MKRKTWYPLDNAAKVYPPVSNSRRPSTFSLIAVLNEPIDKDILQKATNEILDRFETFNVKLKRGIFWYYLEKNDKPFEVREEMPYFLKQITADENNGYLFRVLYKENRINMVFFHSLCDGTGALDVFKSLVYEYLLLSGKDVTADDKVITCTTPYTLEETFDSFNEHDYRTKQKPAKEVDAFKTDGTNFKWDGCGITTGVVDVESLKKETKKYDATITEYLGALYMHCLYHSFIKGKRADNKNVKLLVPVNLRKWYPSHTLRNFAMFVRVGHNYEEEITFEECIELCKSQIKKDLTKENLDAQIWSNVKTEKNVLLKLVPLFIKDFVIRMVYNKVGDNLHTANISNLGRVDFPDSVKPYVRDVAFIIGTGCSTKTHLALISHNNRLSITFTREMVENQVEKMFFRELSSRGIVAEINSNYWEEL